MDFRGNARDWLINAKKAGYETGNYPLSGSVMVSGESIWGHVAYVLSVNQNERTFKVKEMNYRGFGVWSERIINFDYPKIKGFIY